MRESHMCAAALGVCVCVCVCMRVCVYVCVYVCVCAKNMHMCQNVKKTVVRCVFFASIEIYSSMSEVEKKSMKKIPEKNPQQ